MHNKLVQGSATNGLEAISCVSFLSIIVRKVCNAWLWGQSCSPCKRETLISGQVEKYLKLWPGQDNLWFWRHPTIHFILYTECKGSPVRTKSRCNHRGVCINALDVPMCYIPFVASHVTIVRARFGYSGFGIRSMLNMFHHFRSHHDSLKPAPTVRHLQVEKGK